MTDKGALSPAWSMSLYWHKYSCSFLSCQTQPKLHLNNFEYFSHPMFVFTKQTPRAFQKVVLSYTWVWQASSEELVFTVFVYIGAWLDSCKTAGLNSYWTPSTEQANSCGPSGPASQITNYNTVQQAEREKKKEDKPWISKAWNDSNTSLFLPVHESLNSDSLLSHQGTIMFTLVSVHSVFKVNQCVYVHPCAVWFLFFWKWESIDHCILLLAGEMQDSSVSVALSFSLTHTAIYLPTHTPTNTCDVRWCQTGIPHIAPDTPVFIWHFPWRTGTNRQPANLHSSPVDDLHLLKIAPILSVSLSLYCTRWI